MQDGSVGLLHLVKVSRFRMSQITSSVDQPGDLSPSAGLPASLPEHTQLPDLDCNFVLAKRAGGKNFQEPPEGDF